MMKNPITFHWTCSECKQEGTVKVHAWIGEYRSNVEKRHMSETRQRCLVPCGYRIVSESKPHPPVQP
jgi:hypothetical protein